MGDEENAKRTTKKRNISGPRTWRVLVFFFFFAGHTICFVRTAVIRLHNAFAFDKGNRMNCARLKSDIFIFRLIAALFDKTSRASDKAELNALESKV